MRAACASGGTLFQRDSGIGRVGLIHCDYVPTVQKVRPVSAYDLSKSVTTRKAPDLGPVSPQSFEEFKRQFQEKAKKESDLDAAAARAARPLVDRLKKEFIRGTAILNEKRLELAEVEERYDESK
jgi:hypothetical protein